MALNFNDIDLRVKIEGKDPINQFPDQRADFIRDTCIEISCSQKYNWLQEVRTLTVPTPKTDWIDLPTDFNVVEQVGYQGKFFQFVREDEYFEHYYEVSNDMVGCFRIRYNSTTGRMQLCLINGPDPGQTITLLERKYLTAPEQFPDTMEEIIVKGAVARFCTFLEGDDLPYAEKLQGDYRALAIQMDKLSNNRLSSKVRRGKTNLEIDQGRQLNLYGY